MNGPVNAKIGNLTNPSTPDLSLAKQALSEGSRAGTTTRQDRDAKEGKKPMFAFTAAYCLALQPDGALWKIALLTLKDNLPEIVLLKTLDIAEMPIEALKKILHKKSYFTASGLPADTILLRELEMEVKGWAHILSALPFQAEELIPFPKEQTILYPILTSSSGQGSKVRLIATKKDYLDAHITLMLEKGIDPHFVTTTVHALRRWARFVAPENPSCFVLYLNKEQSFVILLRNGELCEFKVFSLDHLGNWHRVKEYFAAKLLEGEAFPWIVAGELHLLDEKLESLDVPEQLRKFALPIGIGLESLARDQESVQWRKESLTPPSLQKRQTNFLLSILALLVSASAIFGPLGHSLLQKHDERLFERAQTVLEKIGTPAKRMNCADMLKLLQMQNDQLEQEKYFGVLSPSVSWFLNRLGEACVDIDQAKLPSIASLRYEIDTQGKSRLQVEWTSPSKEIAQNLKKSLMNMEGVQLVHWKENDLTISTLLKTL